MVYVCKYNILNSRKDGDAILIQLINQYFNPANMVNSNNPAIIV